MTRPRSRSDYGSFSLLNPPSREVGVSCNAAARAAAAAAVVKLVARLLRLRILAKPAARG